VEIRPRLDALNTERRRLSGATQGELKMSTNYVIVPPISASELFDGRLEKFGVREHVNEETTPGDRCLTDGNNYLWLYVGDDDDGDNISSFKHRTRYGNPSRIFDAIFNTFDDVGVFSEHDPQYHGFETREQWVAWENEYAKKEAEECLVQLVKYLRGEPHKKFVASGLVGAKNIKKLFKKDKTLILPENHDKLLKLWMDQMRGGGIAVTLSAEDIALVEMVAGHEKDLPQA
jgi:hypothetical protein